MRQWSLTPLCHVLHVSSQILCVTCHKKRRKQGQGNQCRTLWVKFKVSAKLIIKYPIKMSYQNVSSKYLIKMSHQNVSLKFLVKMSHQNVSSKCLQNVSSKCPIKMSHKNLSSKCLIKNVSSKYLIKMFHQNVSSKCFIKRSHQNVSS